MCLLTVVVNKLINVSLNISFNALDGDTCINKKTKKISGASTCIYILFKI